MTPHVTIDDLKAIRQDAEERGAVFNPFVEFWRDEHLILAAHCVQQDIAHTMAAIQMLMPILEPTHIAAAYDINLSTGINPSTGKPWEPGEMTEAKEAGLPAAAAIKDAIMLMVASNDDLRGTIIPYSAIDGVCHWHELEHMPRGWDNSGGGLVQGVREAYDAEGARALLRQDAGDFGLTPKQAEVHMDAVAIKALLSTGQHHVAVGTSGDPEWDSYLEHSLNHGPSPDELASLMELAARLDGSIIDPGSMN